MSNNEARLKNIIAGTNVGTWEWNVQEGETIFDTKWAEGLGYSLADLEPMSIKTWETLTHPDDLKRASEQLERHFSGELPYYDCEIRMRHKDGRWVWIQDRGRVVSRTTDGKPLHMAGTHMDINDRKLAEEKIRTLLQEKELLLKETHHRVKNDMQTIHSLLLLQADASNDQHGRTTLTDAAGRLQSMMMLYDKLYRSDNFSELGTRVFLEPLILELVRLLPADPPVRTMLSIADVVLSSKILSPIGIIMNELVTNTMKYAFNGCRDRLISVSLAKEGSRLTIDYADNGRGLPESVSLENSTGFGLVLVGTLVEQIKGSVRIERQHGTRFLIELEV
jgi:PAS domain S-box-containing protein